MYFNHIISGFTSSKSKILFVFMENSLNYIWLLIFYLFNLNFSNSLRNFVIVFLICTLIVQVLFFVINDHHASVLLMIPKSIKKISSNRGIDQICCSYSRNYNIDVTKKKRCGQFILSIVFFFMFPFGCNKRWIFWYFQFCTTEL